MATSLKNTLFIVVLIDAIIWLIGVPPTLYYALGHQALPEFAGIRLMGGPFEALGINGLIVAGLIYIVVSGLKFMAAYWLRQGKRDGAVLQLILLGLSLIFWYGFALPLGPLLGVLQLVLLALTWKTLA